MADARIDWDTPALAVDRAVRALTAEPGAWTTFRGQRLGLWPVQRSGVPAGELTPGRLAVDRKSVLVGTATSPVRLGLVQPPGKRPMPAADWARGARPGVDESFDGPDPTITPSPVTDTPTAATATAPPAPASGAGPRPSAPPRGIAASEEQS